MQPTSSIARTFALSCLATALLSAGAITAATAQTTTVGTRGSTAQANPAVTTNASSVWKTYSRAEDYAGAVTLPLQFITMKNGKKLAVLVSVPADANGKPVAGAFPVILTQTAYRIDLGQLLGQVITTGNSLIIGGKDAFMIKRGYISVAVDVVGSGMSDGQAQLLGTAEQQGYAEAVDWVTQQPWFNGNLGLAGTSYLGITSLLTAEQQNPAVKAVFAQVPIGDSYRGTVGVGGMLNAQFISVWLTLTQGLSVVNDPAKQAHPEYADQITAATQEHIAAIDSWYLPTVNNGLAGLAGIASDDGDFWAVRSPLDRAAQIKVPTFIIGGSTDIFQRDEPTLYEQMKNNVDTKLVILKGSHVQAVASGLLGSDNAISNGPPNSDTLMLQWFDQYLKGMNTGAKTLPNVTQYVQGYGLLGTSRFSTATDWPHPLATPQRMYLHSNMSLSTKAPTTNETAHTISEPAAPVITYSKTSDGSRVQASVKLSDGSDCSMSYVQWTLGIGGVIPKDCYTNGATVEKAQNALIYQTPMLTSDLYINGPIQADIWMSATNTEAAVAVRVDDVDLFGNVYPITTGLMSASHRAVDNSRSRYINGVMVQPWHPFTVASKLPIVPGEPMLVPVEIFPTAALIRKGHKLRIAISASNQAQGIWPAPQQAVANGNVSTIYNDPAHPSSVVLPLVPASLLN